MTGDYGWWACGKILQQKWVDFRNWTTRSISTAGFIYKRNLVYATLRDVREPAMPILLEDIRNRKQQAQQVLVLWRRELEGRAVRKYGAGSEQAKLCSKEAASGLLVEDGSEGEVAQDKGNLAWLPTWETIMKLGLSPPSEDLDGPEGGRIEKLQSETGHGRPSESFLAACPITDTWASASSWPPVLTKGQGRARRSVSMRRI